MLWIRMRVSVYYCKYPREPLPSAVRSWQKPLAGAIRRIRCHSHPRMLHHHSSNRDPPPAAYFLLSCSLCLSPFLLSRDPPIYCVFKSFSLSLSLFPSPSFPLPLFSSIKLSSLSLFPSWSHHRITARGPRQNGVIYKPINSDNKLGQRATNSDPCLAGEHTAECF